MSEKKEKVVEKEEKKTTEKKEVKDEKKTSGKKVEKKSNKSSKKGKESFINKDNYLYYIFGFLVVIVIILAILVLIFHNKNNYSKSNVVMPVMNDYVNNEMNIDMVNLVKKGDYSLKITNYRNDTINKKDINYTITVTNSSDANIKVTKDDDNNNLMNNSKIWVINDVALGNNTKNETIYHFSVIDKDKVKKGDTINIKIES